MRPYKRNSQKLQGTDAWGSKGKWVCGKKGLKVAQVFPPEYCEQLFTLWCETDAHSAEASSMKCHYQLPLFNRRSYQSLVSEIPDVGTWSQTLELTDVGTWSQSDRLPTSQPKRMLQPDASRMQPMKKAKPATILQLLSAKTPQPGDRELRAG